MLYSRTIPTRIMKYTQQTQTKNLTHLITQLLIISTEINIFLTVLMWCPEKIFVHMIRTTKNYSPSPNKSKLKNSFSAYK